MISSISRHWPHHTRLRRFVSRCSRSSQARRGQRMVDQEVSVDGAIERSARRNCKRLRTPDALSGSRSAKIKCEIFWTVPDLAHCLIRHLHSTRQRCSAFFNGGCPGQQTWTRQRSNSGFAERRRAHSGVCALDRMRAELSSQSAARSLNPMSDLQKILWSEKAGLRPREHIPQDRWGPHRGAMRPLGRRRAS